MDKKKILIGTLVALILVMAVGYALLAQQLKITGTTSITSNWQIEITNIEEIDKSVGSTTKNTSYTATTANFSVGFTSPGDYAIYKVEVTNKGTLDAKVDKINTIIGSNAAINYELSGLTEGQKIEAGNGKAYLTVTVSYDSNVTTQPENISNDLTVTIDCVQWTNSDTPSSSMNIGDKVTLKNGDTYIVLNNDENSNYITLMKEFTLADDQIFDSNTEYGYTGSFIEHYLNNTFLPTLTSNSDITWDSNSSVRLIAWEEFEALAASEKGRNYLSGGNSGYWWATRMYGLRALVYPDGTIHDDNSGYANGVRPVIVTLKTNIQ